MKDQAKHPAGIALMAAAVLLLVAVSADAIKLGPLLGPGRVGKAYRNTLRDALGNVKKQHSAIMRGDDKAAAKYGAEAMAAPANFVRDVGPAGAISGALGKIASTTSRITKGLKFAKDKISRIFGGAGSGSTAAPDPRAALAVDKASRREYVARSDIFDRQRLSARMSVRALADDRPDRGRNEDVWADAQGGGWDDGAHDWGDDRAGRGGNEDVWADAEGGSWDDGVDDWGDDRTGRGGNEDVWADAEGAGWDDRADNWGDDAVSDAARQAALNDMREREAEERERRLAQQRRQARLREQARLEEEQRQRRQAQELRQARLREQARLEEEQQQRRQAQERERQRQAQQRRARQREQARLEEDKRQRRNPESGRGGQSGLSCDDAQHRLAAALEQIEARRSGSGSSGRYCAAANIISATSWAALRCLEDPTVDAEVRQALRAQIETNRDSLSQTLQGFRALASAGASCACWTDICRNGPDSGSFSAVGAAGNQDRRGGPADCPQDGDRPRLCY